MSEHRFSRVSRSVSFVSVILFPMQSEVFFFIQLRLVQRSFITERIAIIALCNQFVNL